ncbi:MAG: phosphatidylinositol mannoside acyltransferase [Acidobacteria bacterium]|nr:phosphatidylinositol mannoside acyltransferase [Acidobacteriota bacterium]
MVGTRTYRLGASLARRVPRRVALAASRGLALGAAQTSRDRKIIVERNLRRVYGDSISSMALRRKVQQTFESYARYYVDSFRLPDMSRREVDDGFSHDGFEHIERAHENGQGCVVALPHLGGWEWAAFWLALVPRYQVTAVVEPLEPPEIFEWFLDFRRSLGMNIVPLGPDAGTEVLRAAREGHVVCLISDRDLTGDGIEVNFFGETTKLPAGAAMVALRAGVPLLTAAVYFRGDGVHGVAKPLDTTRMGRFSSDVERLTGEIATSFEGLIRQAPEQWHLMQPNWPSDYDALGIEPPGR